MGDSYVVTGAIMSCTFGMAPSSFMASPGRTEMLSNVPKGNIMDFAPMVNIMPFGMCKPGPDCGVSPNAGWAKMPEKVTGFSQTHVSGTGGGQKYGNILIQPGVKPQKRVNEEIALGYYATTFEASRSANEADDHSLDHQTLAIVSHC